MESRGSRLNEPCPKMVGRIAGAVTNQWWPENALEKVGCAVSTVTSRCDGRKRCSKGAGHTKSSVTRQLDDG